MKTLIGNGGGGGKGVGRTTSYGGRITPYRSQMRANAARIRGR